MDIIDLRRLKPPDELSPRTRRLLLPLLTPLSGMYGAATGIWRAIPGHPADMGVPTISVGSLAVGGTGKTPICMLVARRFRDLGRRVCVLSRGYRRKSDTSPLVVRTGRDLLAGVEEAGDEPYMMARRLPGVGVIVGRDRQAAAIEARDRLGSDLLVLDDGFQVKKLARHADVLCFDRGTLRGGNAPLPRGTLREGWSAIRPGHVAVVRLEDRNSLPPADELAYLDGARIFYCARSAPCLLDAGLERVERRLVDGKRFALVSGIAKPAAFERACDDIGATTPVSIRYEDHHWYTGRDAATIRKAMEESGCSLILTTEKDIWKFPADLREISLILTAELDFLNLEAFWDALDDRLREGL